MNKRDFLKTAGIAAAATAVNAPAVIAQSKSSIRWRLQTYAGASLAEHVVKPAIDSFNEIANGDMTIELFTADQLVPTPDLFNALQKGTLDAVQSDDDSMASPADVAVFGGYFPFATRYSLDVPVLFHQYGLKDIWEEAYAEIDGVTWLSAGSWDPCHFNTVDPIRSLDDLKGKRVFTFPTAGKFLSRFGIVPVTLPWDEVKDAVRNRRVGWLGLVRHHRGVHRRLGRRDPVLFDQQHLRRVVRVVFRQRGFVARATGALAGIVPRLHGQFSLLPPTLVLGRRGPPARCGHKARTHVHPGRGVARSGSRSPQVLG